MIQRSLKSENRYSTLFRPVEPGSGRTQSRSAAAAIVPLRPTALRLIVRREPRGHQRLACPLPGPLPLLVSLLSVDLPHLLQPLLLRCRRAISSADPLDFAASALRSSIRATPSRRSAATADAIHAGESGPDSSFQPERPAAPGSVLEAAGRCPRTCPGFGWPGPPSAPEIALLRDSEGLVSDLLGASWMSWGRLGPFGTGCRDPLPGRPTTWRAPIGGSVLRGAERRVLSASAGATAEGRGVRGHVQGR